MDREVNFFSDEELADLYNLFPETEKSGHIANADVRLALETLGCTIVGHELREIQGTQIRGSFCDLQQLWIIYAKIRKSKTDSTRFIMDDLLKGVHGIKEIDGTLGAKHTVSKSEEKAFSKWINKALENDIDCKKYGLLPIDEDVDGQLYERCRNGIILSKMINRAVPNTIDERIIEKGKSLEVVFKRNENLTLVVNSAAAIGCCMVNIGPEDIAEGKPHLVLGLIWQLIKKSIIEGITLSRHSELAALLLPGETIEELNQKKPEDLLIRWVNYHLSNARCDRRLTNFHTDIQDSIIYANLMEQIAPDNKREEMVPVSEIILENSLSKRATIVMENARSLDATTLMSPEDIFMAKESNSRGKLNLVFVATLFNLHPGLKSSKKLNIHPETFEEKTYRNWINSMGVSPHVDNLYTDLSNGLVLLQLIDIIHANTVDWKIVTTKFDKKRELFQRQNNCVLVIDYANSIGLQLTNVSGENIREGEPKQILGCCFKLIRAYMDEMLRQASGDESTTPIEDVDILSWVNEHLKRVGDSKLGGFRDTCISTSRPIIGVLESILPGSTDKSMLTPSDSFSNAIYALSACRKAGARIFALPEHICRTDKKMILTIFAGLLLLSFALKTN